MALRKIMHVDGQVKYLAGRLFFAPTVPDVPSLCPAAAMSRHLGWSGSCPLSPG